MTMPSPALEAIADELLAARAQGAAFTPVRLAGRPLEIAEAYGAQRHLVDRLAARTASAPVGYKIGLTSPAMQQMCGIAHPVYGRVLDHVVLRSGASVALADYGRLGVEFELAVRLGRDIPHAPSLAETAAAIDGIAIAIELIDDRGADYAALDAASLVADNAWNAGAVFGPWQAPGVDLADRTATITFDGETESLRLGDLGRQPVASARWLAGQLVAHGQALRRGEVVLTGSIVRTVFPRPGSRVTYAIDGLGELALAFPGST